MYQPYPSGGQTPEPQRPGAAPPPVVSAVRLMYAGAVLTAVVLVVSLFTMASIRTAIHNAYPSYSASKVHSAAVALVTVDVFIQVVTIGLWLWMAMANKAGKNWARIVSSVLFGLNTLFVLLSFLRPHASLGSVLNLLIWLIGLFAIILLWRKESSGYFAPAQP
jgi:hypothetical protein